MKNKPFIIGAIVMALTGMVTLSPHTAIGASVNCGFDTTITQSSGTFSSAVSGATYQWLYCSTGYPISGATQQTYTPTFGGSYAVVITLNGCTDTTACLQSLSIIATGVNETDNTGQLSIAAIGNGTAIKLVNNGPELVAEVMVVNINGQVVLQQQAIVSANYTLNTGALPTGVYNVIVTYGNTKQTTRFFKTL